VWAHKREDALTTVENFYQETEKGSRNTRKETSEREEDIRKGEKLSII